MQIAILVEQMRREGYEVLVSRPEVIYRTDKKGNRLEPIERLFLETPKDAMAWCWKTWLAARRRSPA